MTSRFYKRDGKPYTGKDPVLQWGRDMEVEANKTVKQDRLKNGIFISTVWLGLDHQYGEGEPLIFETMVFWRNGYTDMDMRRYSTEHQAVYNHNLMVKKWSGLKGLYVALGFAVSQLTREIKWKLRV